MASANLCEICNLKTGRYTCPRCNKFYCSTTCYQSRDHNDCSEGFFKDCIDEMLQSTESTERDPKKQREVDELLKRANNLNDIDEQLLDSDDDDESIDVNSLGERLEGVDLDDSELVWSKLTENERKEYFEFLQNGELIVDLWKPFWGEKFETKLIELEKLEELKKKCPSVIKIKDFKTLSNKKPADSVRFNLVNILASYAFITRYFDGDFNNWEAVSCICQICSVFKSNGSFDDYDSALKAVVYEYKNLNWVETSEENEKLLSDDLNDILSGPHITEKNFYVFCCLSDLSRVFKNVLKGNKSDYRKKFQSEEIQFEARERIKMHIKKLDYYLSYVKDLF